MSEVTTRDMFIRPFDLDKLASAKKWRWGTLVPRMGGGAIGCYHACETKPLFNLSWDGFYDIDVGLVNYWPDVPYYVIDKGELPPKEDMENLDFVMTVCPCGGLSTQNTAKNENKGVDAPKNEWMYKSAEWVLENLKPTVYFGENAQALFTERGKKVTAKLYHIAKKHGYSFSLYKTDLLQHRIPQHRVRCFYFMWKSDTCPIMDWVNDPWTGTLTEFLDTVPKDATYQDVYLYKENPSEHFKPYKFLLEKTGLTHAECVKKYDKLSVSKIIWENGWMDECIDWLEKNYPDASMSEVEWAQTYAQMYRKFKKKLESGRGIFDRSPYFSYDRFKCVIRRNIRQFVHPTIDRYINMREYMTLLGFPFDYQPTFLKAFPNSLENFQRLTKGVVSNVSRDCCLNVMKAILGLLPMSEHKFIKQNNLNRKSTVEQDEDYDLSLFENKKEFDGEEE